ncbi:hypothetical protein DOY81_003625, partial [Sarcophaga bullata]
VCFMLLTVACVLACDPDGNNKPVCSKSNLKQPIRNFWDPTHYWVCSSAGAEPESVRCPDSEGFDPAKGACISFDKWQWTEPCPEAAAKN